jgi:hypothetical protein
MEPDSKKTIRGSFRDFRRRFKGIFKSSSAQPSPPGANSPSSPSLPTATQIPPTVDTSLHKPSAQPLPTHITPPLRANVPTSSSNPSLPTTSAFRTGKDITTEGWTKLETALRVLKEGSGVFPPLKSAAIGLLGCLDVFQVRNSEFIG